MPSASSAKTPKPKPKPYDPSAQSITSATPKTIPTAGTAGRSKGNAWTGDELKALFHFALKRDGRSWDEAVVGRTANQALQTWSYVYQLRQHERSLLIRVGRKSLVPFLEKALEDRAGGKERTGKYAREAFD
jgi:hypothetical protein